MLACMYFVCISLSIDFLYCLYIFTLEILRSPTILGALRNFLRLVILGMKETQRITLSVCLFCALSAYRSSEHLFSLISIGKECWVIEQKWPSQTRQNTKQGFLKHWPLPITSFCRFSKGTTQAFHEHFPLPSTSIPRKEGGGGALGILSWYKFILILQFQAIKHCLISNIVWIWYQGSFDWANLLSLGHTVINTCYHT